MVLNDVTHWGPLGQVHLALSLPQGTLVVSSGPILGSLVNLYQTVSSSLGESKCILTYCLINSVSLRQLDL